ncbi:dnaJ homolog subfamily C member 9 isoform X1 [Mustela nigripes]|uniref:DnaJ homolog subfamily C member 9 n=1 Tax=Mustela putorius furo TaxID=9669 RepID=A0A8U0T8Q9_MUSPF|nr:dnaJ homolog subfamily C member 9 isoform X1 [Mustela putorius furo]XP_059253731.1 dnaJ homolog subfamily C member 9 isoform X1 [Mustela nigripes]
MGLLELCEEVFGTSDLYRVLGVRREASDDEVRRGYHKVSLRVHPDRVGEDDKEDATRHFQILGKVYSVLSDKEQRALYDEQGTVDEDSDVLSQDRDWETYWRLLFKKISLEDIQAFEKTYKGSEEELADIKQAYLDFKGDMDQIMESVLCVQYTDEPRIRNIIQQAIDAGEIPSYNAFVKESKQKMNARKRRAQEEAKEAEISRKELGLDEGVDNLKSIIQPLATTMYLCLWIALCFESLCFNFLNRADKRIGKKKWTIFWLKWKQSTANLPKEEGKKRLSRKKRNNGIFSSEVLWC